MITLMLIVSGMAQAHEVLPSIMNLSASEGSLNVEIDVNAEALLANVDLSTVEDTDAAENAADYDALRGLAPDEIETRFADYWPIFFDNFSANADGTPIDFAEMDITVHESENESVIRISTLRLTGSYPTDATHFQIGWDSAYGTLIVRQNDVDGEAYTATLNQGATTEPFLIQGGSLQTGWQVFGAYIPIGFDHIVPKGLDHILFVLGLFFLSARIGPLLTQVSLFTLAHTLTLALAALGYVRLPGSIVEPLIAASIVFVALENIFTKGLSRWRPIVVFGFGLLHGLGFASVLAEFGLPDHAFIPALIGFNIGVEVGQLAVIAVMFLCVWQALRIDRGANEANQGFALYAVLLIAAVALSILNPSGLQTLAEGPVWLFTGPLALIFVLCIGSIQLRDQVDAFRRIVAIPASIAIAVIGAYWFIERVFL
ncbi:membrane protein [Loktanella sp. S4079]|nr:membrane protein [Loktanella sp. S4079]